MRTLKLLEQHHQRLSELLKFPSNAVKPNDEPEVVAVQEKAIRASPAVLELQSSKNEVARSASPRRANSTAPGMQVPRRMPPRDMSSSIASNLASARGIRSLQERRAVSPSITTQEVPGNLEVHPRKVTHNNGIPAPLIGQPSSPPSAKNPKASFKVEQPQVRAEPQSRVISSATEEGFQRFYSTFETFLSRISAPLAFAGLPLTSEEPPSHANIDSTSRHNRKASVQSAASELDLSKFISKAALRASSNPAPGADSFYVVPTAGHTVSYANILSFADKEKRRIAASMHSADPELFEDPDDDDFVDAKETLPPSPATSQRSGRRSKGSRELENLVEELQTQNKSLKECMDQLTKRLHAFESAAQSSGLAMQESMRLMKPASPTLGPSDTTDVQAKLAARVQALEEQLLADKKDMQAMAKENDKLRSVLSRYRDKWEKLKQGARERREGGSKETPSGSAKDP